MITRPTSPRDKPEDVGFPPVEPTPVQKAAAPKALAAGETTAGAAVAIAEPEKKKPDILKELVDKVRRSRKSKS